jgi:hypothetical protein
MNPRFSVETKSPTQRIPVRTRINITELINNDILLIISVSFNTLTTLLNLNERF